MKKRILFICTHNSACSQMAEGLLRSLGSDQLEAFSAGTEATQVRPLAIKAMAGSCTSPLRIIPPARESSTMPPLHNRVRGPCHDSTPLLLSADGPGTPVVLYHAVVPLAQPRWDGTNVIIQAHHNAPQTLQRAQSVHGSHPQAALCCLCPRGHASSPPASYTTRADAADQPTSPCDRYLEAFLSACRLSLSRLVGPGQSPRQWPSQWRTLATVPLHRL